MKTTSCGRGLDARENAPGRGFRAERPGRKWVSDVTCLRVSGGWMRLTVALDLFDRKVIGWALSDWMEAERTLVPALGMAGRNRSPLPALIFRSDRGSRYSSAVFRFVRPLNDVFPKKG